MRNKIGDGQKKNGDFDEMLYKRKSVVRGIR